MIKFVRKNFLNRRFLRFGIVGVAGVFGVKPIIGDVIGDVGSKAHCGHESRTLHPPYPGDRMEM